MSNKNKEMKLLQSLLHSKDKYYVKLPLACL